jgi:4-hydroxythreonine-4-phosphate dehydrogenase
VTKPQAPSSRLPLGITCGDPAGIGPEITLKALDSLRGQQFRIIGPRAVFEREQRRLRTHVDLGLVDDSVTPPGPFRYGRAQPDTGRTAFRALEQGVRLLRSGQVGALVTAPVSKDALRPAGFTWPGQTEFLAERLGARRHAMLAWTPRFKAVFVTIHLPLSEVSRHITAAAVAEKAGLLAEFLRLELGRKPRLCALAFNPHGREFSRGEEDSIAAGVALAIEAGIDIAGPLPADAALSFVADPRPPGPSTPRSRSGRDATTVSFDAFLAMYHDQAMIPAKLLARGQGVNVTLGLPSVRTSPLHGTAFDIAGKGVADPRSMLAAIRLARTLSQRGKG